jgi:hypothetical protein
MAKLKNPLFSMEARGALDGLCYGTWRGISYVKGNTTPSNEDSYARGICQTRLIQVSRRWKTLTDVQRSDWNLFATQHLQPDWTGTPIRLTGFNWFVRCNATADRLFSGHPDDAPVYPFPDPPDLCALSIISGGDSIGLSWGSGSINAEYLEVWMTNPLSTGVTPKLEMAHFHTVLDTTTGQPFELLFLPESGRYGCWIRSVQDGTGLFTPWLSDYIDYP